MGHGESCRKKMRKRNGRGLEQKEERLKNNGMRVLEIVSKNKPKMSKRERVKRNRKRTNIKT